MAKNTVSVEEKKWQAQDDAHTLARANEIKKDSSRMKAAQVEASKMYEEQKKRADSLKSIAAKTNSTKQSKSNTSKMQQNTKVPGKKK
jgi:hypothetical protein